MVASRELSQELAKYYKLDTEMMWWWKITEGEDDKLTDRKECGDYCKCYDSKCIPAPNVAELLKVYWDKTGHMPSLIGKKPEQVANFIAKEIICYIELNG